MHFPNLQGGALSDTSPVPEHGTCAQRSHYMNEERNEWRLLTGVYNLIQWLEYPRPEKSLKSTWRWRGSEKFCTWGNLANLSKLLCGKCFCSDQHWKIQPFLPRARWPSISSWNRGGSRQCIKILFLFFFFCTFLEYLVVSTTCVATFKYCLVSVSSIFQNPMAKREGSPVVCLILISLQQWMQREICRDFSSD